MVFKPVCCVCGQEIRPYHLFYRPAPGQHICIPCSEKKEPEEGEEDCCRRGLIIVAGESIWLGGNGLEPLVRLLNYARERSVLSRKEPSRILPIRQNPPSGSPATFISSRRDL